MGSTIDLSIHMVLGCRHAYTTTWLHTIPLTARKPFARGELWQKSPLQLGHDPWFAIQCTTSYPHDIIFLAQSRADRRIELDLRGEEAWETHERVGRYDDRNWSHRGMLVWDAAANEKQLFFFFLLINDLHKMFHAFCAQMEIIKPDWVVFRFQPAVWWRLLSVGCGMHIYAQSPRFFASKSFRLAAHSWTCIPRKRF